MEEKLKIIKNLKTQQFYKSKLWAILRGCVLPIVLMAWLFAYLKTKIYISVKEKHNESKRKLADLKKEFTIQRKVLKQDIKNKINKKVETKEFDMLNIPVNPNSIPANPNSTEYWPIPVVSEKDKDKWRK